ncbi:MAG: SDR family oxidoreductase [Chloroflexota bacterium]|nr:SDR family oxidoreductase [Chloroflexota bacterium]
MAGNSLDCNFAGRVAVVRGGTLGMGDAAARLLAARGAAGLVICGRNQANGDRVAGELSDAGCPTEFVQADLTRSDEGVAVVGRADERFGRLDYLVNCAGVTDRGNIWNTTEELWDRTFNVNVRTVFFMMQAAAKIMRREKIEGGIVSVASVNAHGGDTHLTPYSSSKGALVTLTKNVAAMLIHERIRAHAINLGWADTPGEDRIQKQYHGRGDDWQGPAGRERMPAGRLISSEEVARMIAFLCSEESGMVTGAIFDYNQTVVGTFHGSDVAYE